MRTYLHLYLESLRQLKVVANQNNFSPAGEREFEKHLNRTNRLHQKAKAEEEIYDLTPDARALLAKQMEALAL